LLGERLQGETYYTPEQYTSAIDDQSGRTTTDGDRWPLLYESSSPPMSRRRSRSVSLSRNGSARQAASNTPNTPAVSRKPGKGARHKSFGLCRWVWRVWQKTGRRTCSHTPLCGVVRGCAGLSEVDGLFEDTWSLKRCWWGHCTSASSMRIE